MVPLTCQLHIVEIACIWLCFADRHPSEFISYLAESLLPTVNFEVGIQNLGLHPNYNSNARVCHDVLKELFRMDKGVFLPSNSLVHALDSRITRLTIVMEEQFILRGTG